MRRATSGIAAIIAILCWASAAPGQVMTEQFIPIGQSPGISGKYSYIGPIRAVDAQQRTVTIDDAGTMRTIKVTEQTHIWIDRSKERKTNLVGDLDDLRPGAMVEIKYVDYQKKQTADWIKVEAADGS